MIISPPPIFAGQLPLAIHDNSPAGTAREALIAPFERENRSEHRGDD